MTSSIFADLSLHSSKRRRYRYEKKLACLLWKVDVRDLILPRTSSEYTLNNLRSTVNVSEITCRTCGRVGNGACDMSSLNEKLVIVQGQNEFVKVPFKGGRKCGSETCHPGAGDIYSWRKHGSSLLHSHRCPSKDDTSESSHSSGGFIVTFASCRSSDQSDCDTCEVKGIHCFLPRLTAHMKRDSRYKVTKTSTTNNGHRMDTFPLLTSAPERILVASSHSLSRSFTPCAPGSICYCDCDCQASHCMQDASRDGEDTRHNSVSSLQPLLS